jgi:hypothetical protein
MYFVLWLPWTDEVEKGLEYLVTAFPGVLRTGEANRRGVERVMRRRRDSIG